MAVTFSASDVAGSVPFEGVGQHRERILTVVAAGTYTAGGDALSAATLGFTKITSFMADVAVQPLTAAASQTGLIPRYDFNTGSVMFFQKSSSTAALPQSTAGDTIAHTFVVRVTGF